MKWLIIGPQTRAVRAQQVLAQGGISSQRRKLTEAGEGCVYAVGVSQTVCAAAAALLKEAGIRIKQEPTGSR